MERIKPALIKYYPPIVLGLADLEALDDVLRAAVKNYAVCAGDYRYESVAELSAHVGKKRINKLGFEGSEPHTRLNFATYEARVYVGDDDLISAGLFQKIDAILTPRVRRLSIIYDSRTWLLIGATMGAASIMVGVAFMWAGRLPQAATSILPAALLTAVILAGVTWSFWVSIKGHSVIGLSSAPDNFLARNRDQILMAFVAALVGSIVTLLVTKLLG
jgi:hypothetical protein